MKSVQTIYSPQMSLSGDSPMGGGVYDAHILQAIAENGWRVIIPLIFRRQYDTCNGWTVRPLPIYRAFFLGAFLTNVIFFFVALYDWLIRKERWSVFRIGDPYYVGIAGILFAKLFDVTTFCHIHHLDDQESSFKRIKIIAWVARRCDLVIALSRFGARQIEKKLGVPAQKITIAYPGFKKPIRDYKTAKTSADHDTVNFTFIGSIIPRKNLLFLIDAFLGVYQKHPQVMLNLIGQPYPGQGEYLQSLKERISRHGLTRQINLTGFVDEDTKNKILGETDVFVFPSLMEGFGMAPVEAMSLGIPCVALDGSAIPEVIRHGKTGLLVKQGDPTLFTEALNSLIENKQLRIALGKNAKRDVLQRFSWDKAAKIILERLKKQIDNKEAPVLGVLLNSGDSMKKMENAGQKSRFVDHYLGTYKKYFKQTIVFSYDQEEKEDVSDNQLISGMKLPGLFYGIFMPLRHYRMFKRIDVFRVMQTLGALPAIEANILFKKPFVTTYGFDLVDNLRIQSGVFYPVIGAAIRNLALKRARFVIVTTDALAGAAVRWAKPENIVLVPNGVDLAKFSFSRRQELSRNRLTKCLFVGRLVNQKNLEQLFRALQICSSPVSLKVVGEGPQLKLLKQLADELSLEVEFAGVIPYQEMPDIYRQADLLLLTSLGEGMPKVLLEAFASGLPCIGTNVRGINDIIVHRKNGLLCGPEATSIAEAIETMIGDPELSRKLADNARMDAETKNDLQVLLNEELELLKKAITN